MSSELIHKRRLAAVVRGVGSSITSYVDHASGGTLTDVDGREWIDFAAGIAVTNVGNSAPRVVEAVRRGRALGGGGPAGAARAAQLPTRRSRRRSGTCRSRSR